MNNVRQPGAAIRTIFVVLLLIGASCLSAEVKIADTIEFPTPGSPDGAFTTLSYRIDQR